MNSTQISAFAVLASMSTPVDAQTASKGFNTQDCTERTALHWCASQAKQDGWTVTHRDQSRPDMMDASWLYEIWRKDREVMLCMYSGGRGGDRINLCSAMSEVR